jgi:4a-hydroxytetrahydrobiopterin dehydratase
MFATRCGEFAEEMNHHPDLLVQWRKVTAPFRMHSCKGLTKLDFEHARRVEELLPKRSAAVGQES